MLQGLNKLATKDKNSDWDLRKGPSPGVKYRSGQPPAPPQWHYSNSDLRAFQKWERRLQIYVASAGIILLPAERGRIGLLTSLRAEMEEELQWADDLKQINSDNGIDFIVESLRKPLKTREVYVKRISLGV